MLELLERGVADDQIRTRREFEAECGDGYEDVVAGQCSSGVRFLARANGYISEVRYFDTSGNFIGLQRSTDFDPVCISGSRYFPEVIECTEVVSERLCSGR